MVNDIDRENVPLKVGKAWEVLKREFPQLFAPRDVVDQHAGVRVDHQDQ